MRPYKRTNRRGSLSGIVVKVALIAIGVIAVFFIIRAILHKSGIAALHPDEVRQELESKKTLIARNTDLQNQISTLQTTVSEAQLLKQENETLKAELGRATDAKGILARVLTTPDRSFYDTMIIDAGAKEGVQEGQVVYAFGSIALGTVSNVRSSQSTVELFSAPNRETPGTAEGSETAVTLIGRGAGEYEVRMPRDVHFSVGEFVTLQTVQTAVLAKIEKIVTDPRDPFQRLLGKAPVNVQALKFVIVR